WIAKQVLSLRVRRTPHNGNPYALVQILTPREAIGREWGQLFFCGQADGVWPPPMKPAGYLGDEVIRSLNENAKRLNAATVTEGPFGDGSFTCRDGKAYCVGPLSERSSHLRDLVL